MLKPKALTNNQKLLAIAHIVHADDAAAGSHKHSD